MKKLAVIILNWNGKNLLQQFLPTAIKFTQAPEVELIVADNGSSDGSTEWIKETFPHLTVFQFSENHGFAKGYNIAVEKCKEFDYVTLLNSDVLLTDGWWQPILEFMEHHSNVGAVQPKIKSWHHREYFEYAGAAGGLLDNLQYPYCRGRLFDIVEKDEGQFNKVAQIAWASGACLTVRTSLYLNLGGLDPAFFAHQEEIDLCIRIQNAGYKVCYIPDSEIFHVGGASLSQDNPRKTYLNFRNNLLLIYKNSPRKTAIRRTILRRIVDTAALIMFIIKGDFKNAQAIYKAHRDFGKMTRNYTVFPENDILPHIPGANKSALLMRYFPWLCNSKKPMDE